MIAADNNTAYTIKDEHAYEDAGHDYAILARPDGTGVFSSMSESGFRSPDLPLGSCRLKHRMARCASTVDQLLIRSGDTVMADRTTVVSPMAGVRIPLGHEGIRPEGAVYVDGRQWTVFYLNQQQLHAAHTWAAKNGYHIRPAETGDEIAGFPCALVICENQGRP